MSDGSNNRFWKSLDSISDRLSGIESNLAIIVRLEEKVSNHQQVLSRHGSKIDTQDQRIRDAEIWLSTLGDRRSQEKTIDSLNTKINAIESSLAEISTKRKESNAEYDTERKIKMAILKWLSAILAAIIIYQLTR